MKRLLISALALFALGASCQLDVVVSPSRPTVGDLITLTFPANIQRVLMARRPETEIVRSDGNRVVVRSFRPGPLSLDGTLVRERNQATRFNLMIRIHSVLQPNDSLEPAALRPPRPLPPSRAATIAIALAAMWAALSWFAVFLLARRRKAEQPRRVLTALEEFRAALAGAARTRDPNARLIQLAEATRTYLARTDAAYRQELTTFELAHRLPRFEATSTILELLAAADLAKFSPWGPEPRDYGYLIERLGRIPEQFERKAEAA